MYKLILLFLLVIFSLPAYAYIGPGMSGGIFIATLGLVVAIIAAILSILYFPIKRFINNKRKKKKKMNEQK